MAEIGIFDYFPKRKEKGIEWAEKTIDDFISGKRVSDAKLQYAELILRKYTRNPQQ